MEQKGKTENKNAEEYNVSLNRKTFLTTLFLSLGIGVTVLIATAFIYIESVAHEYTINTWNQANAEAAIIGQTDYKAVCDKVIDIYDSCSEEDRGDGTSDEYIARYAGIRESGEFQAVLEAMHSLQNRNGPLNAFLVALDPETNRMIYIVDADQSETSCLPGTWDNYSPEVIDTLINGIKNTRASEKRGSEARVQAVFTNFKSYGWRCTAGSTLYRTENYTVMVCVDEKLDPMIRAGTIFLVEFIILIIVVTLLASYIGMRHMRKIIVLPINRMAEAARKYGDDDDKQSGQRHFDELDINTGDEIERLADTLKDMESDVAEYMDDLTTATAEREHIATELALASKIQMSMLQLKFPAFPGRTEFEIFASMEPAKGVGGDFYDMIMVDDDHLAIEIADVSGKGIPAALFMMVSKIMLANEIRSGKSPEEVLEMVNEQICHRNDEEMFITVWLGILEVSTGKMITANAGHEYPILVHADGTAEVIHDNHGLVIGGLEGMKYDEHHIQMKKGDSIFVYTDGVTEATSKKTELFGMGRTLEAAGSAGAGADPEHIMMKVRESISDFIGNAEQFDDLTMLCMRYNGPQEDDD